MFHLYDADHNHLGNLDEYYQFQATSTCTVSYLRLDSTVYTVTLKEGPRFLQPHDTLRVSFQWDVHLLDLAQDSEKICNSPSRYLVWVGTIDKICQTVQDEPETRNQFYQRRSRASQFIPNEKPQHLRRWDPRRLVQWFKERLVGRV